MSHTRISKIKSLLDGNKGVAKSYLYSVDIKAPRGINGTSIGGLNLSDVCLLAEATEIPGRQIVTTPQIIYGTTRKMPYGVLYNDLPITFICPGSMNVRKLFDAWQSLITNPFNNFFNYYEDYVGNITIYKTLDNARYSYFCDIHEVYPITIDSQPLSYGSSDYLRLTVQFAYRRWVNKDDLAENQTAFPSQAGYFQGLEGAAQGPTGSEFGDFPPGVEISKTIPKQTVLTEQDIQKQLDEYYRPRQ